MSYHLFSSIKDVTIKDEKEVKQDIYQLWRESFGDSSVYTDFYFDWKVEENQVFLIYYELEQELLIKQEDPQELKEESKERYELAAMLHLNPYLLEVKDKDLGTNYIVGVATKKTHRRKGLMAKLLDVSMEQMYKEEMPFTYLMPAKESIYLPFDFRIVYEQDLWNDKLIQAEVRTREREDILRVAEINNFKVSILKPDDFSKISQLVSFTNAYLENEYDVFVKRTPYYYKRLIAEMRSSGGQVLLLFDKDELMGYLSYMAEEAIYITELITYREEEQEALEVFWNYLSSRIDLNIFKRKPGSQIISIMTRIVNLKVFVRMLTAKNPVKLVLEVSDPIIQYNQGRFVINVNENGGSVEETKEVPDLSINIADLTRLFFGKLETNELEKYIIKDDKNEEIKETLKEINFISSLFINDVV